MIEACRYFERNRAGCGTPGLFSEEYDIRERQLRGNLPQTFVHALTFEASSRSAWATLPGCTAIGQRRVAASVTQ